MDGAEKDCDYCKTLGQWDALLLHWDTLLLSLSPGRRAMRRFIQAIS